MRIKGFQGEKNILFKVPREKDRSSFTPPSQGRFRRDRADCPQRPGGLSTREGPEMLSCSSKRGTSFQSLRWCLAPTLIAAMLAGELAAQHCPSFEALLWPCRVEIPTDLHRYSQALQDVEIISDYSRSFQQHWRILYSLFGNYTKASCGFIPALQFTYMLNP